MVLTWEQIQHKKTTAQTLRNECDARNIPHAGVTRKADLISLLKKGPATAGLETGQGENEGHGTRASTAASSTTEKDPSGFSSSTTATLQEPEDVEIIMPTGKMQQGTAARAPDTTSSTSSGMAVGDPMLQWMELTQGMTPQQRRALAPLLDPGRSRVTVDDDGRDEEESTRPTGHANGYTRHDRHERDFRERKEAKVPFTLRPGGFMFCAAGGRLQPGLLTEKELWRAAQSMDETGELGQMLFSDSTIEGFGDWDIGVNFPLTSLHIQASSSSVLLSSDVAKANTGPTPFSTLDTRMFQHCVSATRLLGKICDSLDGLSQPASDRFRQSTGFWAHMRDGLATLADVTYSKDAYFMAPLSDTTRNSIGACLLKDLSETLRTWRAQLGYEMQKNRTMLEIPDWMYPDIKSVRSRFEAKVTAALMVASAELQARGNPSYVQGVKRKAEPSPWPQQQLQQQQQQQQPYSQRAAPSHYGPAQQQQGDKRRQAIALGLCWSQQCNTACINGANCAYDHVPAGEAWPAVRRTGADIRRRA